MLVVRHSCVSRASDAQPTCNHNSFEYVLLFTRVTHNQLETLSSHSQVTLKSVVRVTPVFGTELATDLSWLCECLTTYAQPPIQTGVGSRMGVVGGGGGGGGGLTVTCSCSAFIYTTEVCSVNERCCSYALPPSRSIISFQLLVTSSKL